MDERGAEAATAGAALRVFPPASLLCVCLLGDGSQLGHSLAPLCSVRGFAYGYRHTLLTATKSTDHLHVLTSDTLSNYLHWVRKE